MIEASYRHHRSSSAYDRQSGSHKRLNFQNSSITPTNLSLNLAPHNNQRNRNREGSSSFYLNQKESTSIQKYKDSLMMLDENRSRGLGASGTLVRTPTSNSKSMKAKAKRNSSSCMRNTKSISPTGSKKSNFDLAQFVMSQEALLTIKRKIEVLARDLA